MHLPSVFLCKFLAKSKEKFTETLLGNNVKTGMLKSATASGIGTDYGNIDGR